jgi:hypothetical protein
MQRGRNRNRGLFLEVNPSVDRYKREMANLSAAL